MRFHWLVPVVRGPANRHPWRSSLPHQGDFFGRQAVGFVHKVADFVFQRQGFGRKGAGGSMDRAYSSRRFASPLPIAASSSREPF